MLSLKPMKIILVYAAVSILWIVFSDNIATFIFSASLESLLWSSILKGCFYVVVTSCLLWTLLKHVENQFSRQSQALLESESRYRSVIQNIPDVYYRTDAAGNLIMVSPSVLKLLKYESLDDLLGRPNASFWQHPGQRSRFQALLREHGEVRDYEVDLLRADNTPVTVSTSSKYYHDCAGGVAGVEGIFRDITERKRAEAALKQSEERLRRAELVAGTGNWEIDLTSGRVHASEGARHIYGLPDGELTVADIRSVPLPEYRPLLDKALRDMLEDNAPYSVDFKILRPSDAKIIDISSMATYDADSNMIFGVLQDITERRRMQEVMVQTEKMMSVGGLAAGMAHEINNPLSGILQNVQVLLRRMTQESAVNAEAARDVGCTFQTITDFMSNRGILEGLESIRESSVRAAAVVKSMLEFSRRSESGKTLASMNEVLDKALELCATDYDLKKKFDFRKIGIRREYAPGLPDVLCSKTQIQQVAMNLLGNAAHALKGTPSPLITVRTMQADTMLRIEVEDNGPGMDEPTRRKIFEPFFTTKPVGEGTGLGLSVSYFIITNNHRGTIQVETEPGKGARFIISLPA